MIKNNLKNKFENQFNSIHIYLDNIFVADYTEASKNSPIKREVEIFSPNPPTDIEYFSIYNPNKIEVVGIKFNNNSFVYTNGNPKSQCESVFFPNNSTDNTWILFCELKYSSRPANNQNNLCKALKQLFKTRYHYIQANIITMSNPCYLIASLPLQREPFINFSLTPSFLLKLKEEKNIILRLKNSVEILDDKKIIV